MSLNATLKTIAIGVLLCISNEAIAQDHFFININETNGKFTNLSTINNIDDNEVNFGLVSYDKYNHRYILYSYPGNPNDNTHLITIDAPSGKTIYDIQLSSLSRNDYVNYMPYAPQTGKLMGLHTITDKNYNRNTYFSSIDPSTGVIDTINEIKNLLPPSSYTGTINNSNHTFTFIGEEKTTYSIDSFPQYIYTIDINTGNIIARTLIQPAIHSSFLDLEYDPGLNKYYAAMYDYTTNSTSIVNIDPVSGNYTSIYTRNFQNLDYINLFTYDAVNHHYIFLNNKYCFDSANKIFSPEGFLVYNYDSVQINYFDVVNLSFAKKTNLPIISQNTYYALYGCQYDDTLNTFYSLYMGPEIITASPDFSKGIHAYPNPFSGTTYIPLNGSYNKIDVVLFNSTGSIAGKQISYGSMASIDKNGLMSGIYYATLYGDGQKLGTIKLMIQ